MKKAAAVFIWQSRNYPLVKLNIRGKDENDF